MTEPNVFEHSLKTITSLLQQIEAWPVSMLIWAVLVVLGSALHRSEWISDKNIPLIMLLVGPGLNVMLGDVGSISPSQRNPELLMGLWGFLIAFIAWMTHKTALRRFKNYVPVVNGDHPTEPPFTRETATTTKTVEVTKETVP